ncbi:hypothetical protein HK096_002690 [Nowakowskiella sp. JEL0078]|nr:hypothetical protein HK096_002690 [Nowakowskiella sp. JEL0078]
MTSLPSISELNLFERQEFFRAINTLFETAPPLADRLYEARPFVSYEHLIKLSEEWLDSTDVFSLEEKVQILNAHPRIGAPKEVRNGFMLLLNNLSVQSYAEQGYSKDSDIQSDDEVINQKLQELNTAYEKKYGFKFVVFVAGRLKKEIVSVLEDRLENGTKQGELKIGLDAMMLIARDRLKKIRG